jgi:hypothetical protein
MPGTMFSELSFYIFGGFGPGLGSNPTRAHGNLVHASLGVKD